MFHQHVLPADQLGDGSLGRALLRYLCACGTHACKCGTRRHGPGRCSANAVDVPGVPTGSYRPTSNQAAREGEPATFPKHDLPASLSLPEPHLKSTPLHPPDSPAHLLTRSSTPPKSAFHFSLIYGARSIARLSV